jgi:hypothetical protein
MFVLLFLFSSVYYGITLLFIEKPETINIHDIKKSKEIFIDYKNSLVWQNQEFDKNDLKNFNNNQSGKRVLDWDSANRYCQNLKLSGIKWRIPKVEEIESLLKSNENILNGNLSKNDMNDSVFWLNEESYEKAFLLYRGNNTIRYDEKDSKNFVVCVSISERNNKTNIFKYGD